MINPTEGHLADHKQGRPLQASAGMSVERTYHPARWAALDARDHDPRF